MSRYRSRSEIVYQILVRSKELQGVTKTRIMYKSYLSFTQLREYLKLLVDNGLLEHIPGSNAYRTSEKGLKIIEVYGKMYEFVSEARQV